MAKRKRKGAQRARAKSLAGRPRSAAQQDAIALLKSDHRQDARVKVLSEMIKHHVNEEEKRDGMFAKARQSDMDLTALGETMAARKAELLSAQGGSRGT
jgi:hypothetical protein